MGTRYREKFTTKRIRFITTTCKDWLNIFSDESYFNILRSSLDFVNKKYPCEIMAYVFMPNHLHLVNLFEDGSYISDYMRDFKKFTASELRRKIEEDQKYDLLNQLIFRRRKQVFKIWQDRFDDVYLERIKVIHTKINYIHQNPVRKGLVQFAKDYRYSSASFYETGKQSFMNVTHYLEAMGWGSHYEFGIIR